MAKDFELNITPAKQDKPRMAESTLAKLERAVNGLLDRPHPRLYEVLNPDDVDKKLKEIERGVMLG